MLYVTNRALERIRCRFKGVIEEFDKGPVANAKQSCGQPTRMNENLWGLQQLGALTCFVLMGH